MLQYIQMSEKAAVRGHMLLHIHVSTQPTLLMSSFFFHRFPRCILQHIYRKLYRAADIKHTDGNLPNILTCSLFCVFIPTRHPASPTLPRQLLHPAAGGLEAVLEAGPPALAAEPLALHAGPLVEALLGHVLGDLVDADLGVEQAQPAGEVDLAVEVDGAANRGPQPVLDVGGGLLRQARVLGQVPGVGREQVHVLERVEDAELAGLAGGPVGLGAAQGERAG